MPTLEFTLHPADAARLLRPASPKAPLPHVLVWHDTADDRLARDGRTLCRTPDGWLSERAVPASPGLAPATEAAEAELPPDLASDLREIAAFKGHRRGATLDGVAASVLAGEVHGVSASRPACRLRLDGPGDALAALLPAVAALRSAAIPRGSLAAEAFAVARGTVPPPASAPAGVAPDSTVGGAVATVLGGLLATLLDSEADAAAGRTPEGVHRMRVAVRRLRSAVSVFRSAAPGLAELQPGLRDLATALGDARDWDVFLAGAGADLGRVLPDDARVAAMLALAERHRAAAYRVLRRFLASEAFRALCFALVRHSALGLWDDPAPIAPFAAAVLRRRWSAMRKAGPALDGVGVEALHALRKDGKRLRYAAEFFAPVWGKRAVRDFTGRLAELQEALGHLNDAATAAALAPHLGGGFAAGCVQGYAAGRAGDIRAGIGHAWRRFRKADPFW